MCTFSENGDGKNAESTRARFTPRAGGRGAGTTRSSELSPSAVAFSGRPIRPDPWLRGGVRVFPPRGSAFDWRIRGLLDPVDEKHQDGKTKRKILGRENAPQVSRSYPNVARDRPRCRRGGRGGQPRAPGARTECHGERGAREPPFFPLKTESSDNYW